MREIIVYFVCDLCRSNFKEEEEEEARWLITIFGRALHYAQSSPFSKYASALHTNLD